MLSELFHIEKFMGFGQKVMYFLGVNILFLLSNFPVLLFFFFVGISEVMQYLPLFMVTMLPFGPSLCAVFYAMNRVREGRERGALRDFAAGYRSGLGVKYKISVVHLALVFMVVVNMRFFAHVIPVFPVVIVCGIMLAVLLLIMPMLYLLASRYEMGAAAIWKDAVILSVIKPYATLGNAAAFALMLIAIEIQAGTAMLFISSVYGFLVVFMNRGIFQYLEKKTQTEM